MVTIGKKDVQRSSICADSYLGKAVHDVLGQQFVTLFIEVKRAEAEAFLKVISPWEREYLLLNV